MSVGRTVYVEQFMLLECHSKEMGKSACIGGLELFIEGSTANKTTSESSNKDDEKELMQILHQPEFYKPTADELQRGIAYAAPKYWGVHVRRSKSLRVAFIGGSQTVNGEYVDIFRETMNSIASNMGWSFAVYNEGVSGQYPSIRPFKFLSLPSTIWPNVICIEPCLNCANDCSSSIDKMKYFINRQYELHNLDEPYYMFLEFFPSSWKFYMHYKEWSTITERIAQPVNITNAMISLNHPVDGNKYKYIWTAYSVNMMQMARFYGIPVLSEINILYPSLVRFYLTHHFKERWPYTKDGAHTGQEGCQLIVDHILKPFFLDQMTPRESDKLYEKKKGFPLFGPYPIDLRMFKADMYTEVHIIGN
jgi:hypothetical protein